MQLVIGNKNYSSWSLRPWLLMAAYDLPFEELRIPLDTPETAKALATHTPAGKVPFLRDAEVQVWDSLAICEYISERYLDGRGWPSDMKARAEARSCSAEMHSGFFVLRRELPMNCRALGRKVESSPELEQEILRISSLWQKLRHDYGAQGPWLFGEFSIADCMFAPVVFRFRTYGILLSEVCQAYVSHAVAHPKMKLWLEMAAAETETLLPSEVGISTTGC